MLKDQTIQEYIDVLASGAPAPGGGSAAALAGAQGAALGAMVTELSIGKKKYLEDTEALSAGRDVLRSLAMELTQDIDRDTAAFNAVSAAMKLPKDTAEQREERKAAIQRALLEATHAPMNVCRRSAAALEEIEALVGKSNTNAASDLGTGAAMLRAATQGAWLNILINLSSLADNEQVAALMAEGRDLYERALKSADAVYAQIEAICMPDIE
ncbi:cyclodeaminase/cyclohydrolase family protein [Eubacteriales bacterium OttesenSCG-928-A19]|nr:cyclodeaminase/cyclohydrolase family protein [Eubacteriales bacterium OttesenSCG-928-A19]